MTFLHALDYIGAAVFAVSGALAAGRRRLDLLGVVVLALVTAVGGGTIRDVLLARHPIFWLADQWYLVVIAAAALATVAYTRWRRPPRGSLLVADGLGLALFSMAGAQIAESRGFPILSGVTLGTVTGVAGGAVRDILCAEIPLVLRRGNLYASAAIAGTLSYFFLEWLGVERRVAALAGMTITALLRFASIWLGLSLPVYELQATGEHRQTDD